MTVAPEEGSFGTEILKTDAPSSLGVADELKKLSELRDSGVLTEDEFAKQKRSLLNPLMFPSAKRASAPERSATGFCAAK
jgi:hypothetical protein